MQVTGTASLDITRPPAGVGVQAYKVFLIQVRARMLRQRRLPALLFLRGTDVPWGKRAAPLPLAAVQELCTCPLRMVLQHGALQINPNKLVRSRAYGHTSTLCGLPPARSATLRLCCAHVNVQSAVASLLHQVATGLEYLHGRGIIHGGAPEAEAVRCRCMCPQPLAHGCAGPPPARRPHAQQHPHQGGRQRARAPARQAGGEDHCLSGWPASQTSAGGHMLCGTHVVRTFCRTLGCRFAWRPRPRTCPTWRRARPSTWRQR